ncbi:hypothetical protein SPFM9_00273 [Salmonella phage SPFM9]|nr:hypothetical protein SPFM9_00273 [Salmonella phage SPFM9]
MDRIYNCLKLVNEPFVIELLQTRGVVLKTAEKYSWKQDTTINKAFLTLFGDGIMFSPLDRKVKTQLEWYTKLNGKPQHIPSDLLARKDFPKLGLLESHTGSQFDVFPEGSRDTLLLTHMPDNALEHDTLKMYGEKHENDFQASFKNIAGGQDKMTPNQLHSSVLCVPYLCSYRSANKVFPVLTSIEEDINNLTATARAVALFRNAFYAFEENRERLTPDVNWKGELPIHSYQEIYLNLRTSVSIASSLAFEGLLHTGEYAGNH